MLERDVAPGIHRVEDAYANWYLVEEDGGRGVTVVDAGLPRSWGSLQSALSELSRKPADVGAVLLTHAHPDHIGFAERARRELGVSVYLHERDRSISQHPFNYEKEHSPARHINAHTLRVMAAMGRWGALRTKALSEVRAFAEEEELDVPGRPHPVPTPGHTHGHTAYAFPDRGAVVVGDALATIEPYSGRRRAYLVSGAANADSSQALASLQRIADTGAGCVLVGHGPPWRGGAQAAVDEAREHGPS